MCASPQCVDLDKPDPPRPEMQAPPDDPERCALLESLKEQVRRGVYRPDVRDLARSLVSMMVRDL